MHRSSLVIALLRIAAPRLRHPLRTSLPLRNTPRSPPTPLDTVDIQYCGHVSMQINSNYS